MSNHIVVHEHWVLALISAYIDPRAVGINV